MVKVFVFLVLYTAHCARLNRIAVEGEETAGVAIVSNHSDEVDCHPWDGYTQKVYVKGWQRGSLGNWLSFKDDGNWLYAKYTESSAMPLFFKKDSSACGTYKLRNDWQGHRQWVSFTDDGKWLRATYSETEAMPVKFKYVGGKDYKMLNMYGGREQYWVSYTDDTRAVRAIYSETEAMVVHVHVTKKPVETEPVDVKSMRMCLRMLASYAGGSTGTHSVTVTTGSSWSSTTSTATKVDIQAKVSTKIPLVKASMSSRFMQAVQTANAQSGYEEKTETFEVDFEKSCYLYQGEILVTLTDGSSYTSKGLMVQENEPLTDQRCVKWPEDA